MTNELPTDHAERISAHYAHAKAKHPHFADKIQHSWYGVREDGRVKNTNPTKLLEGARRRLAENNQTGDVSAFDVLTCEVYEIAEAAYNGRRAAAVEECYDAVAVLLRMAEMIEAEAVQAAANAAAKEAQND